MIVSEYASGPGDPRRCVNDNTTSAVNASLTELPNSPLSGPAEAQPIGIVVT